MCSLDSAKVGWMLGSADESLVVKILTVKDYVKLQTYHHCGEIRH